MWAAHELHLAILLVLVCVLGRENASDRVRIWLGEDLRRLLLISCLCQSRLKSPNLRIFDVCGSVILSTTGLRSMGEDERKWDIAFDQRASCYNKKIWFAVCIENWSSPFRNSFCRAVCVSMTSVGDKPDTFQCNSGLIWRHSCVHQEQKASSQTC